MNQNVIPPSVASRNNSDLHKYVSLVGADRNTYIDKALHHACIKCSICGDTSSGQTQASLPSVIALFSMSDLLTSCSASRNVIKDDTICRIHMYPNNNERGSPPHVVGLELSMK